MSFTVLYKKTIVLDRRSVNIVLDSVVERCGEWLLNV